MSVETKPLPDGPPFFDSLRLWSHIDGNLYQGGCVNGVELPTAFRHVVSLYPWEKYTLGPDTDRIEHEFFDSEQQELTQVLAIATTVNDLCADGPTLVHCQAGLNRSGLVVATALVLQGWKASDALAHQRGRRDRMVLCNGAFERFVLALPCGAQS
jgi:protein-tyrosine phosphatase